LTVANTSESQSADAPGTSVAGESDAGATDGSESTTDHETRATQRSRDRNAGEATTPETTYTARFAGFIALFGVLVAMGLITLNPVPLAASGILLVFLLASLVQTPAAPGNRLSASYDVRPRHPRPADTVTVSVTVTNDGDSTLTDLRLVDTVPNELQVVTGSPRGGGPLGPGESLTIEYEVVARRGEYSFGPIVARTRTLVGSMWTQQSVPIRQPGEMRCAVLADDIPLEERATHFIGSLLADSGGEGVEFYSTREYHRGDPPSKIHWRELAKRGELSTITYRERQAAEVTILTDGRPCAHVSARPGEPNGAHLSGYATYQLMASLVAFGHYVGVAVPGLEPEGARAAQPFPYRRIDPGRGDEQQRLALELLDDIHGGIHDDGSPGVTVTALREYDSNSFTEGRAATERLDTSSVLTIGDFVRDLTGWTTPNTQYICVTPLLDDAMHGLCRQLQSQGYPIVIISPDVTTPVTAASGPSLNSISGATEGRNDIRSDFPERMLRLQRATRIEAMRQQGFTVIDWHPSTPLSVCTERQTGPGV
jgi:uncharacterized repeat protein (TIGR01451 family)